MNAFARIDNHEVAKGIPPVPTVTHAPVDPTKVDDIPLHRTIQVMKGCDGITPQELEQFRRAFDLMPAEGQDFLGFRLLSEIGRGTFGRVFLAVQYELANRRVALKIAPDVGNESDRLARLQHTNIVPIHSVYLKGELQAICMPYLGSNTLVNLIAELRRSRTGSREKFPLIEQQFSSRGLDEIDGILTVVAKLAEGLAHAHERKVLHCDLKPANVLLSDDGQPMLLDFNLSMNALQVTTAAVGGTLPYMPPEQLRRYFGEGPGVDERSDLYSLGVILFEMLTGDELFETPNLLPIAGQVTRMIADRNRPIPSLKERNPKVTPAVQAIVERLLAPEPEDRYRSADELRDDLQRQIRRERLKHAPDRSWREGWTKFRYRNPRLTSIVSLSLMAFAVVAALVFSLIAREDRLKRWEASEAAQAFDDRRRETAFLLTGLTAPSRAGLGIAESRAALARFKPELVELLPEEDRPKTRSALAEMLYFQAIGHGLKARQVSLESRSTELDQAKEILDRLATMKEEGGLQRAVLTLQAELERTRGDEKEARRLEHLAGELRPQSSRDLYLTAVAAFEKRDYPGAIAFVEESLRADPTNLHGWSMLGVCRERRGESREAVSAFSTCIALRPDYYAGHFLRGVAHLELRLYAEAKHDFTEAIRLNPQFTDAYLNRSLALMRLDDAKRAESDLNRVIDMEPERGRAYLLRHRARVQLKDREGAEADRKRGFELTPVDPVDWVTRGLARLPADPQGALRDYDEALRLDPRFFSALQSKSALLVSYLKRPDDAIRVFDEALIYFPDAWKARAGRGILLARKGKREEAIRDAEAALDRDRSAMNLYQVAGIYAQTSRRDPDDAIDALRLLSAALRKGFGLEHVEKDTDLEPIRDLPRFKRIVAEAKERAATEPKP